MRIQTSPCNTLDFLENLYDGFVHSWRLDLPVSCTCFLYLLNFGMNYGKAYKEARALQEVLFAVVLNAETPAKEKAACARAWDTLEDRKRELRGKPKLATVKVPPKSSRPSSMALVRPVWSE